MKFDDLLFKLKIWAILEYSYQELVHPVRTALIELILFLGTAGAVGWMLGKLM